MRSTKKIRQTLGISQQQLAAFLGIPRSHISMYEGGRRELPTAALVKLALLENSLQNNTKFTPQPLQAHTTKDLAVLQQYARKCSREAKLVQTQLQQMKEEYQQGVYTLMAVEYLFQQLPTGKTHRKDQLWLELLQANTLKKLQRCGMAEQVKLMLKEQALQQTIAAAETMKF